MAPKKLTKDEANRILVTSGFFHGLFKLIKEYDLTAEQGAKIKVGLFDLILAKVLEAKGEIAKLQSSVNRLEAQCRAGLIPNKAEGLTAFSNSVNNLLVESRTFDGWTISLLESDISLVAAIENPETAGIRVKGLTKSFAELWALRVPGWKPMARHPEVFDMTIFVP